MKNFQLCNVMERLIILLGVYSKYEKQIFWR